MQYLLDTNTVIYWLNGNKAISERILFYGYSQIAASDITHAEMYYGAYKSEKVEENIATLKRLATKISFLPLHEPCQERFGMIKATLRKKGQIIEDADIFIAATAIAYRLILVTNNTKHFDRIEGLQIENWA